MVELSISKEFKVANRVYLESQAWWDADKIVVPEQVGRHVHIGTNFPLDQTLKGIVHFDIDVKLHNQPTTSKLTRVDVQVFGSGVDKSFVAWSGTKYCTTGDCSYAFPIDVDTTKVPYDGRLEFRFHAFVSDPVTGQKGYPSTGWQAYLANGGRPTQTYRTGNFLEARGWYTNHGYAIARLTSPISSLGSGKTVGVKMAPGSGGKTTTFSGVYIDPDFHHGSSGIVVKQSNAAYTGNVVLPVLPSGSHKIVLVSSDGKNVGVLAIPFSV